MPPLIHEPTDTDILERKITQCENWGEMEELMARYRALYVSWTAHIQLLFEKHHLNTAKIMKGCGVKEGVARGFWTKIPAQRESVIMLAMMMHMTVDETNELLTRWGRFSRLYARNPRDAIWTWLLIQGGSDRPAALFEEYYLIYQEVAGQMKDQDYRDTLIVSKDLENRAKAAKATGNSTEAFRACIQDLQPDFEMGYQKLQNFIEGFFRNLEQEDVNMLGVVDLWDKKNEDEFKLVESKDLPHKQTPKERFGDDRKWYETYRKHINNLRDNRIVPDRAFLVALGLHMRMNMNTINTMLDLAGMGPLCAKDPLEAVLVFHLEGLYCAFPSYFDNPNGTGLNELIDYCAKDVKDDEAIALPDIVLDPYDYLPAESIFDYIRRSVLEHDVVDLCGDNYVYKLLKIPRPKEENEKKGDCK